RPATNICCRGARRTICSSFNTSRRSLGRSVWESRRKPARRGHLSVSSPPWALDFSGKYLGEVQPLRRRRVDDIKTIHRLVRLSLRHGGMAPLPSFMRRKDNGTASLNRHVTGPHLRQQRPRRLAGPVPEARWHVG